MVVEEEKWTCDMYYLSCWNRGKEDYSKPMHDRKGRVWYRCFCLSKGIYDNKPCSHAYLNDKRLVPRRNNKPLNGEVRIIR